MNISDLLNPVPSGTVSTGSAPSGGANTGTTAGANNGITAGGNTGNSTAPSGNANTGTPAGTNNGTAAGGNTGNNTAQAGVVQPTRINGPLNIQDPQGKFGRPYNPYENN